MTVYFFLAINKLKLKQTVQSPLFYCKMSGSNAYSYGRLSWFQVYRLCPVWR